MQEVNDDTKIYDTILGSLVPLVLVGCYVYICFSQLQKQFYVRASMLFIQIYYISIILAWLISTYMPLIHWFPDPNITHEQQQYQNLIKNIYFPFSHLLAALIPELCVNYLMLRYAMQQAHTSDPKKIFIIFVGCFGAYIIGAFIFESSCWFGFDICNKAWYQYGVFLADSLPMLLGVGLLIFSIYSLRRRQRSAVVDVVAAIRGREIKKVVIILGMRIVGVLLMLGWNIIHENGQANDNVANIVDQVLEVFYKAICGSIFMIRVNW